MRIHGFLALVLVSATAVGAACSSGTTQTQEPVATGTATADMEALEPTSQPSAQPTAQPPVAPTTQPTAQPTAQPPAKPAKAAWKDLTHDQKMEVMKTEVMPAMTKTFQGFDPKEFAKFDCATCHGKGAKAGKFAMPNAELPKLNPDKEFAAHKKDEKHEKILAFMFTMTPELAGILNAEPMSPSNPKGFGCFSCHTKKK